MMGMPLVYVIGVVLIPEDKKDNPPFGEEDTKYTSIDMETTARAPILSDKADYEEEFETLEAYGPFVPTFLTDTKKVWSILLACFGLSSAWQHVKKFSAQQNGHQAWRTIHNHFFGGDKVSAMVSEILLTLKSLHYSGDPNNFTFDKYCTAHVDQHNCHAALSKRNAAPLEESMKIHYFEDRITDPFFASVKSTIMVDHLKCQEFDAVMQLMLITSTCRKLKPQPIKPIMSLLSKVAEVADKAVGGMGEADKVDMMPAQGVLYLKKKLTR